MTAILEARGLTRDYSVSRGAFRSRATIKALSGVSFSLAGGPHAGGRGRIRVRQIDAGAAPDPDRKSDRRRAADRRRRRRARERGEKEAPQAGNPDRVPEPVWFAQSAPDDREGARGAAPRQHAPQRRRAQGGGPVDHGQGGLKARILSPLSPHVLRRPAPAHRHRPGADAQAEDPGAGRAGVGARRIDPRPGAQPARRACRRNSRSPMCSSRTISRSCATSPTRSW